MIETWKPVTDFPYYQVSNLGRVKSFKRTKPRVIGQGVLPTGYHFVLLYDDGKIHRRYVHRLVAIEFIKGRTKVNKEVNHIDGDKSNNCETNLEWCNRSYNIQHSYDNGFRVVIWDYNAVLTEALKYETRLQFFKNSYQAYKAASNKKFLDRVCSHMICGRKVVKVRRSDGVVFDSVKEARLSIGLSRGGIISRAIRRNIKAGGYNWEYVNEDI
jgi:hypothetical protein